MAYNIRYSCSSHVGKVRKMNQDNFICDGVYMENGDAEPRSPMCGVRGTKKTAVFGIFDGMGGEERGEVASYLAAKCASGYTIGRDATADLSAFCTKANADICDFADNNGVSSMGTTAAMLAFSDKEITLCNIGDSKIFRYSEGNMEQISFDHVGFSVYGKKPPLSQSLGIPPTEMVIEPYLAQGGYHSGDIYLICSDGLTDMVSNEEIANVLRCAADMEEANKALQEKALAGGGRDNVTILLCKIETQEGFLSRVMRRFKRKEQ